MFETSDIWQLGKDDDITTRKGAIAVDPDDMPVHIDDAKRCITVASGLQPRDFIVTAKRIGADTCYENTQSFLVTIVEADGSGIIVHGDKILQSPREWTTHRIESFWKLLEEIEPEIYSIFGLQGLQTYIRRSYIF